jgi:hypothetical protein
MRTQGALDQRHVEEDHDRRHHVEDAEGGHVKEHAL